SEDDTRSFARLFISEGDGHGISLDPGPGLTSADAMAALMNWVEKNKAPDEIIGRSVSITGTIGATHPVYAYPWVPRYLGHGDPSDAASFAPEHLSKRTR